MKVTHFFRGIKKSRAQKDSGGVQGKHETRSVRIKSPQNIGDNIRVEDLILPDGVVAISSPDQVVARIAMTRTAAVEVGEGMEVEEGEEAEEGEEVAEGEESEE